MKTLLTLMDHKRTLARSARTWSLHKATLLGAAMVVLGGQLNAQTVLIDPAGDGGFNNGSTFASNNWNVANSTSVNQWYLGDLGLAGHSGNYAYISNDGGVTNAFTNTAATVSHFWRDVTLPAGETQVTLSFTWAAQGESGFWDAIMVSVAPTSYTVAGSTTSLSQGTLAAPAVTVASFWLQSTVQTATFAIPSSLLGNCSGPNTVRLIFSWKNDTSGGTAPAGSVDNISMVSVTPAIPSAGGTFTINNTLPTAGLNFASFTAAINAANTAAGCTLTGPITFNVAAGQTFNENPPALTGSASAVNLITFQKSGAGANPVITPPGSAGTTDAGITITGGDFIVFDGIDVNASAGTAVEYGYLVRNANATNGANNVTVRNCAITLNNANTASIGLLHSASTTGGGITPTDANGRNSDCLYENLTVSNVRLGGVLVTSGSTTFVGSNNTVRNCTIGAAYTGLPTNDIGAASTSSCYGIQFLNQESGQVYGNTVRNIGSSGTNRGIWMNASKGINTNVYGNRIYGIRNTLTTGIGTQRGIEAAMSTTGVHTMNVYNNMVSDITAAYTGTATGTRVITGMILGSGAAGSVYNVDFNNVSVDGSGSPNCSSVCLQWGGTTATNNGRNNVLANFTGAQAGVAKHWVVSATSATAFGPVGSVSNYNNYHVANATNGFVGITSTTDRIDLAAWQAALTGNAGTDANTLTVNPGYVNNATDLHIDLNQPGAIALNGNGLSLSITTDIDGDVRGATPDRGADEYFLPTCAGTPTPGTIQAPVSFLCSGESTTLSLLGNTAGIGISFQWQSSNTPGGPYTSLGTANSQATGALTDTTYYICIVTCSQGGPFADTTAEYTLIVNPVPTASATSDQPVCEGQTLTLDGSSDIGTTYSWTGPNGFNPTTEDASVSNITLSAGGNYTFNATANGCTSLPTVVAVTVNPLPTIQSVTATPNPVCVGGNSQLNVAAVVDAPFVRITEITFFRTGTGQTSPWPATIPTGPDDYVELNNTSNLPADISGWTYADYPSGSATANHAITFPPGTVIPPNGFLVIGLGPATSDPANFFYATGGSTLYSSGASVGFILRDNSSVIVDAVLTNTATFNAGLGVTASDWSGAGASAPSTNAGSRRTAAIDNNTGTDWIASSAVGGTQTIGTFNPGYTNTSQSPPASYLWSPSAFIAGQEALANPVANGVNAQTNYTVTVASTAGCTAQGTVTVNTTAPITSASITGDLDYCAGGSTSLTAVPADGGAPFAYLWSPGGETTAGISVTAPGSYSVQMTDNCGGSVNAGSVSVTENTPPGGSITGPTTANTNDNVTYTAAGFTGSPNFQWQTATNIAGPYTNNATTNPLNFVPNAAGTFYIQCIITDPVTLCSTTSNIITLVVSVAGDNVCSAIPIVVGTNGTFSNVGATTQVGEPVPPGTGCAVQTGWCSGQVVSNSVWFSFVAPASGKISVNFGTTATWDSQIALWSAPNCGAILTGVATLLAANDDITNASPFHAAILPICVTPGVTYYVQVDGFGTTTNSAFQLVLVDEFLDTDLDGTTDCNDGCPLDPLKIAPGQCGCGVADTDTDGDATADCNDGCPTDPLKTSAGICGCGVSDADSDGDLTVDCNDLCPTDPLKIAPGLCGCGAVDVDLNNNSICDSQEPEPLVKLGIVETPNSQLELRLLPNGPFYELVASTVTTVRWVTTPGVSITGGSAQLVDPNWANAVGAVNFVSTTTNGIYSYATFVTFGVDQLQAVGLSWAPNVEVPFFRVPYVNTTNACVTFEVVNDAFQASSNREWFVSLNGFDMTDGYIAGKTSATGYPAAICQNTSLTLSGGTATLDPLDISASFTGCTGVVLSASQSVFDCTDVGANTITLTANANGTITTCSATVTVISTLSASATAGVVNCTGGTTTVTVSATGGDAPYSGTGTFIVPAGPYSYTVTDAGGCTSTVSGTVNFVLLDTDGDGLCDAEDNCPTVPGQIGSTCSDGDPSTTGDVLNASCVCVGTPFVDVTVRAILEGPYVLSLNLMRDSLRVKGMLPTGHPYAPAPFLHSGSETVLPGVLAVSGNDAVVDWVLLEVRSNASPATILATRAALIQRDGDITDTDGTSAVRFLGLTAGAYHLAVRHRNHNGVMTASPIALSGATPLLDLSSPATSTFGIDARKPIGGIAALWAGNVVNDDRIKYTGAANDRDPILVAIGGSIPTATISAYLGVDVNLDGTVKYTGTGNDRDPILINIGGSVPTNSRLQQLP